eukprot:2232178-Rhodomonas_salina.2
MSRQESDANNEPIGMHYASMTMVRMRMRMRMMRMGMMMMTVMVVMMMRMVVMMTTVMMMMVVVVVVVMMIAMQNNGKMGVHYDIAAWPTLGSYADARESMSSGQMRTKVEEVDGGRA